ncbi:MAG: nicotinamide riboside transporter PnuC [Muribaculum sp.]|nr:nicotinamide riboside transporter PnuC [Muribaculaceae bacterium]MCM1081689.1 nicotinamide riboside transporter PnuC [Muribaculum sp.]
MDWSLTLEIFGFLIGLLYLWWEYHADARVWLASMIMPAISMWIYFSKGIYADFGINIYYLIMAVYGYAVWRKGGDRKENKPQPIAHTPLKVWCVLVPATALLWIAMAWFLDRFTDSTVPVTDAFTTSLSIVGTWMLARKYVEQWLIWIVVDFVCVGLYAYKGLIFYPILYAAYTVIAIFGYRKWLKLMK